MLRAVQFFREWWCFSHFEFLVVLGGVCVCLFCLFLVVSIWVCRLVESALLYILTAIVRKNKHALVISASSITSHLLRALGHVLLLALKLPWGCSNSCSSCPGSGTSSFICHPPCSTPVMVFFEQLLGFSFQVWKLSNPCFVENWIYKDLECITSQKAICT